MHTLHVYTCGYIPYVHMWTNVMCTHAHVFACTYELEVCAMTGDTKENVNCLHPGPTAGHQ